MQLTLDDFRRPATRREDGRAPCPYCGLRVARVTMTLASGNLLPKPLHLGPIMDCPAFAHWTFELPWWS